MKPKSSTGSGAEEAKKVSLFCNHLTNAVAPAVSIEDDLRVRCLL